MALLIIGILAVLVLGIMIYSDTLTGKKKHSNFFYQVRTPVDKGEKDIQIPLLTPHESFYAKINRVEN